MMIIKLTINEVKKLIHEHTFFIKDKQNEEAIFFKMKDNLVHCFNSHFSLFLTLSDFTEQFKDATFYLYEEKDEEYVENKQYFRQ